jgi:hypothetical protein
MNRLQEVKSNKNLYVKENVKSVLPHKPTIEKNKNKPMFTLNGNKNKPMFTLNENKNKPMFTLNGNKNKPMFTLNQNNKPVYHPSDYSSSTFTPNTTQTHLKGRITRMKADHRYTNFEKSMRLIFPNYSFCCYGEDKYDFEFEQFQIFWRNYEKK